MSAPNVLVCLPTHHDEVHVNFAFSLMETARALTDSGCGFQTMHVGSSHIIRARNFFASYFVAHAEFSHLLFLDTDMQFPPQAVMKLLAAGKCVAGVAYPYRRVNLDKQIGESDQGLSLREWLEKHADYTVRLKTTDDGRARVTDGFVEAEHVGTGIFLARRDAFEAAKPFAQCYAAPEQYRDMLPAGQFYGFFDTIEEQGCYLSEDLSFCRRVRLGGASVWALVDQTIVHYGASEVAGQYLRALRMRGNIG
ncbi:hypothetical protein [Caballeronia ptereochthonis]|uniref:Uncharacterized protein n=1 Tax=Caballeronia ptereochthonis TaxID=1777144 RepID=A0A158A0D1_9BURK|nr:hypothetical protein [Caballeronia ptereochthonis]SAK51248.1 hypothetical protein AWB83_01202 [Caballeronia ptereochthonis]